MEPVTHLAHLRREADALVAAARTGPDRTVKACPGWNVDDLVAHVGSSLTFWRMHADLGPGHERVRRRDVPPRPPGIDLFEWFATTVDATVEALEDVDPDGTWATLFGPEPGTFFARRLALEVAVHRWDVQEATGSPEPIATDLALDGVDELLEVFGPLVTGDRLTSSGTIHLHATDEGTRDETGEWLIRLDADQGERTGLTFEHGHAKGDVAVRGLVSDLLLLAWNRLRADERFEVFGDTARLDSLRTALAF